MSLPTPNSVVEQLPSRFKAEAAGRTRATVQLELTGEGGGLWWVRIADGTCTVTAGRAERPDARLVVDAYDYVRIRLGELDPVAATMKGQMRVEGRFGVAVTFAKLFRTGA
jgi:putative sterol carrier protein